MAKSKSSNGKSSGEDMNSSYTQEFKEFFVDGLKDIYWAEKHLTKAIPKMQKAATSEQLRDAFAEHLEQTKTHVTRLEQIFEMLEVKAQAKKCVAMAGIVEEGNAVISETDKGTAIRDVGLIMSAQKVEHYEIATYGGLAQLAKAMGIEEVKNLLGQTLDEEKQTDELLTSLAEGGINIEGAKEGMEEMEEEPVEEFSSVNLKSKTSRK